MSEAGFQGESGNFSIISEAFPIWRPPLTDPAVPASPSVSGNRKNKYGLKSSFLLTFK
jgi:hypothetical protein